MSEKTWKRTERNSARTFKTERALQEGREGVDFESDTVVGSHKYRKQLPKWLTEAMAKIRAQGKAKGKLPILCLKEKRKHGFLVVIHSSDFIEYFGDLVNGEQEEQEEG